MPDSPDDFQLTQRLPPQNATTFPPQNATTYEPTRPRKDPFKTRCGGCNSMLMLAMPIVHCPACHNVWRARKLTPPTRCARCDFSLWKWRQEQGIVIEASDAALRA